METLPPRAEFLSAIGFGVATRAEWEDLARDVVKRAQESGQSGPQYAYDDPSGARLVVTLGSDGEIRSLVPQFQGALETEVAIIEAVAGDDGVSRYTCLTGIGNGEIGPLVASPRLDPEDLDSDFGTAMCVEMPIISLPYPVPFSFQLNIVLFAEYADLLLDRDYAADRRSNGYGSQQFVPKFGDAQRYDPFAILAGEVIKAERRINAMTGREFTWAQVEAYGGTYDVVTVVVPEQGEIAKGSDLQVSGWLSARPA